MNADELVEHSLVGDGSCKAVNCSVVVDVQRWVYFHGLDALFNGLHELLPILTIGVSNSQMQTSRSLQERHSPVALLEHNLAQCNGINCA